MASFYDTTVGQQVEFQRVLATAGFTDMHVARIIKKPSLASTMYEAIQSKVVNTSPSWYVLPERQLERAWQANIQRTWGLTEADFPSAPKDSSKLLLLVVKLPRKGKKSALQRTFDDRWELIQPPVGYSKYRDPGFKTDSKHLRLAPGLTHNPGIYWVEFEPNAYSGLSPKAALEQLKADGITLSGTEVLDAAWQFPDWQAVWFTGGNVAPNLSALQFRWDVSTNWSSAVYLDRWDGVCQLWLHACLADDDVDSRWGSPSFRRVL